MQTIVNAFYRHKISEPSCNKLSVLLPIALLLMFCICATWIFRINVKAWVLPGRMGGLLLLQKTSGGISRLDLPVGTLSSAMYTLILTGKISKRTFYKVILCR